MPLALIPRASTAIFAVFVIGALAGCAGTAATVSAPTFEQLAADSLARIDGRLGLRGLKADVEVLRDEWGVPHIYAQNVDDLFFAQGFVVAQDRLWQRQNRRARSGVRGGGDESTAVSSRIRW